jgi:hypothetical protein
MMWADFTAGGHSNFFDFAFWRGTGRMLNDGQPSRSPPSEILRGGRYLLDFLANNNIRFWTMAPHDELATVTGDGKTFIFTLAAPGEEYICYVLGNGPVAITLKLPASSFTARWYDPKTGQFLGPASQIESNGQYIFQSPAFKQDIVLYLRR